MLRRSAMRCLQFSCGKLAGFSRVRTASPARFWALRVCAFVARRSLAYRVFLLANSRHIFGFLVSAHCFPRSVFGLLALAHLSQGEALLTSFCLLALLAFLPLCGKKHKNSRHVFGFLASAHGFPCAFLGFSHLRTAFPVCFRALRVCALLAWRVFELLACAHGFPGTFSGFARVRIASPARFWALRVCALLSPLVFELLALAHCFPRHVFGFLALAHGFPGAFSAFSRLRTASPARFWASRACARLSPTRFRLSRVCARLPRSVCRKAEPCLRVFLWKTRGLLACAHLSQGGAVLCRSAMRCLQFSYSQTLGLLAFAHGFLSQGGAVLRRSAMRCLRFSCSQTLGLCAGAGGEKYFQFGSDKNKHTVRSFLWQKLRN